MEQLDQLLKDPANYLFGLGLAALVGVWWARMTPTQGNAVLVIGVLLLGIGVWIKTGSSPLLVRTLWVAAVASLAGLFVNYQLWVPKALTLDAKKAQLGSLENTEYRDLVAEIIQAFEPRSYISVGGVVLGPDGSRSVDIQVWPISGGGGPTVIDVIARADGQPVGVDAIDGAESKRRDLRAHAMLLCSDTGFDSAAIRKAKRTKVGLISALKQGDQRIRGKIEEEIYLRKVSLSPFTVNYEATTPEGAEVLRKHTKATHDLRYQGGSVAGWLQERLMFIVVANPLATEPIVGRFDLKTPTEFDVRGHKVVLKALSINFHPRTQWLSQVVTLDAKAGIYDYVRGRVRLASGQQNTYVIAGVNFDTATPMTSPPEIIEPGVGLQPGEVDVQLMIMDGMDMPKGLPVAQLTELVQLEDLSPTIAGLSPRSTSSRLGR